MTVLSTIPNGASNKDIRDTINALLADVVALKAGGGTVTPTPTPTPAPSFTTPASINSDGTPQVGEQLTGIDGVVTNGSVTARQWLLAGTAISGATANLYTPTQTGDHTYRVTALGTNGSTITSSSTVTVAAPTGTPTPTPTPTPSGGWGGDGQWGDPGTGWGGTLIQNFGVESKSGTNEGTGGATPVQNFGVESKSGVAEGSAGAAQNFGINSNVNTQEG